jgi:AcrR family transcriptional regulator
MAQIQKPALRERVLVAAEHEFAASGYRGATMASIAARAGVSTGNLYRYFPSKEALFGEIFTDAFAETFLALVDKRVEALTRAADLTSLDADARADAAALLSFWIENRRRVIVLLDRADGSRLASFRARFVESLVKATLATLRDGACGREPSEAAERLLWILFENTVRAIVAILEQHEDEREIADAFTGFWSYQLAGLAGFTKWASS